jgi:hypothetical protein
VLDEAMSVHGDRNRDNVAHGSHVLDRTAAVAGVVGCTGKPAQALEQAPPVRSQTGLPWKLDPTRRKGHSGRRLPRHGKRRRLAVASGFAREELSVAKGLTNAG